MSYHRNSKNVVDSSSIEMYLMRRDSWEEIQRVVESYLLEDTGGICYANFSIDWDLTNFIGKELDGTAENLDKWLTISGTMHEAYAASCVQYMASVEAWSELGTSLIDIIKKASAVMSSYEAQGIAYTMASWSFIFCVKNLEPRTSNQYG
ncbi:hypothetical protein P152DRAFT_340388 [Eremomyces bilateralis CBS 781.70]|uniref:Uncharacterized protein n=1 Tax=Eremomyces bilateralis CBS 781.70 TaxID=1392243 RepID=A0A6G1G350_9PEZI|nr:uncharacterized protein P152DRAFT_340388 [Eremomyces bilateralis CBS 781.70]KAF1812473.1 hypothetical protein P152DRAFT_340388 [Eremomyces bilateralis CBS 781.70]